jgi:hypothetical protein
MAKMTKADIQKRQLEIMTKMDEMDEKTNAREAKMRALTSEEQKGTITDEQKRELEALKAEQRSQDIEYDALVRESAGLSARAKAMATGKELEQIREREDYGAKIRELVQDCYTNRRAANATTILANAITNDPGGDNNTVANLEAGGLIPVEIRPIIDTKVPGTELPEDLVMVTGVTGTQVIPYSINDVKFTVEGEVTKVAEQSLDFANITTSPKRVAASVPVSRRAVANAAFDIIAFITYKFQKGWAQFRALHIYAHGAYTTLQSPFAQVTVKELALDDNIGENIAKEIAEMYDLGFEGDPELIMDKVTEVDLAFTPRIPDAHGDKTVIEDGTCVGYNYKVSPYVDYSIDANGAASKDFTGEGASRKAVRYIAIGHFGYLSEEQHGEFRFNVDATSAEVFNRATVVISMTTDYSLTELSSKVNGNTNNKPQAFKLIKLVEA